MYRKGAGSGMRGSGHEFSLNRYMTLLLWKSSPYLTWCREIGDRDREIME